MIFLAIVIALLIERFWGGIQNFRDQVIFKRYCNKVRAWFGESGILDGVVGVLLLVGLPVGVVFWFQSLLDHGLLLLGGLAFASLTLVASIGPRDLGSLLRRFIDARRLGNQEVVDELAQEFVSGPLPDDDHKLNRDIIIALFSQANDWLLGALFWFVLLGPAGAVLYRLACELDALCCEAESQPSAFNEAAQVLHGLLAWLPARITSLAFGVVGDFIDARSRYGDYCAVGPGSWIRNIRQVLVGSGLGALSITQEQQVTDEHLTQALALVNRTVILWLTVFAVLALAGVLV